MLIFRAFYHLQMNSLSFALGNVDFFLGANFFLLSHSASLAGLIFSLEKFQCFAHYFY